MQINRREAIGAGLTSAVALSLPSAAMAAGKAAAKAPPISALRVCGLDTPLLLASRTPHFSWQVAGQQTAWRVTVARSAEDLAAGRDLLWDSGKINDARCFDIAYKGPALPSRSQAVWRVESWTGSGGKPLVSAPARFETGLAASSDWQAEWLACETETARLDREAGLRWMSGSPLPKVGEQRYYRLAFDHDGPAAAEFLASAQDITGVWLNGEKLAAAQDDPVSWKTMAVYPVQLQPGRNVFAVSVKREVGFGLQPPILAAILRHGEKLMQRRSAIDGWTTSLEAPEGWTKADFDAAGWTAVTASRTTPPGEPWPTYPAVHLRREFSLPAPVRRARLYATAQGAYEAWINGARVGDARMAPEMTDPRRRILFQAYDVTAMLRAGANCLGLWVGDGWYASEYSAQGRFSFGPAPSRAIAQLELELANGDRITIASDKDWRTAESCIITSEIYDGEICDARRALDGWSKPGFDAASWLPVRTVAATEAAVEPQQCEPIRVTRTLKPQAVTRLASGAQLVDFGQNFAGWVRLKVRGKAGQSVTMRFAEILGGDGHVDQANLRSAAARDIFILAGKGEETFEPRFTYHGFRYVQIEGLDGARWSVEAMVAHQDLDLTGSFRTGDPVINKFWENIVWSQRSNFFGLPTDCPQRDERLGWTGDAQVFWEASAFNMDVQAYTARFMDDICRGQKDNGAFPDCVPPFFTSGGTSSPGWADAGIILPYTAWRQYGDTDILARNWAAMVRYLAWIKGNNPDHLWAKSRGADYGDWLAIDAKNPGDPTTPKDLIGTAFWANNAAMMAQMADALGKTSEAEAYRQLFATIRGAFNTAYVNADGSIGNSSQTSYILPIRFGLLDDAARLEAGRRLAADIERRGNKLSTGFLGTPYILDALADAGQPALAVTLLMQRDYPSWGYMVTKGATSMWERWNSDQGDTGMNSRNHYAFGAIGAFLFRRIAGIAPATPGFRSIRVAPLIDARLGQGGATYQSASGRIVTDWTARGDGYVLDVELPAIVTAQIVLPDGKTLSQTGGKQRYTGRLSG